MVLQSCSQLNWNQYGCGGAEVELVWFAGRPEILNFIHCLKQNETLILLSRVPAAQNAPGSIRFPQLALQSWEIYTINFHKYKQGSQENIKTLRAF